MALAPALDLRPVSQDIGPAHAPANVEAEQALLGALLYDNGAYERLNDSLQAQHFFEPFHGRLFAAIEANVRRGQLADPTLLAQQFQSDAAFQELGAVRYLDDLALRRELIRIGGEISTTATVGDPDTTARDQIEAAEQQLYTLAETGTASNGLLGLDVA